MSNKRISHAIIMLSFICLVLTLVAIGAQANDEALPQPVTINNGAGNNGAGLPAASADADNPLLDLVRQQLEAIKERDADLAFSYTTGKLHDRFDTPRAFLNHMRFESRPLYNHESVEFISQNMIDNGAVLRVRVHDRDHDPVTVIYRLIEGEDGRWLIDSFAVLDFEADPV